MTAYPITFWLPVDTKAALISKAVYTPRGDFVAWKRLWRYEDDGIVATYPDRLTLAAALLSSMPVEEIEELLRNA